MRDNRLKTIEQILMCAAGVMAISLMAIVCYKIVFEKSSATTNCREENAISENNNDIRRLEVAPSVQFVVNVKSEDLERIARSDLKKDLKDANTSCRDAEMSCDATVCRKDEVITNNHSMSKSELSEAKRKELMVLDLFRNRMHTFSLWKNRKDADTQGSMFMLLDAVGDGRARLFEFTMSGAKITTAKGLNDDEFSNTDITPDALQSMLTQRKALILASERVYFFAPKNRKELACQIPSEGEKLNPAADDFGALYEFVKEERLLQSSLNYNVLFKVANNEKSINVCTVPFGGEVDRNIFRQRIRRFLENRAVEAEKERLRAEYKHKVKGLGKRRVVFSATGQMVTRLDGTIEVPRRFIWDTTRGWGKRLGTWEKGQEKEQQRYARWLELKDEAERQEQIMKELKAIDRDIDRNRYVRIDKLDIDDALNKGYAYIVLQNK